jgi:sugar O-acyltransferase (sialic acid O-acetyltransferase NeuD family)
MGRKQLVIYGAGGLGRELSVWIKKIPDYDLLGFVDDNLNEGSIVDGVRIIGGATSISSFKELHVVIGVGDPESRLKIAEKLVSFPMIKFPALIHPRAIIEDVSTTKIGEGTIITAGCVLTTGINIGKHVLINLNSTMGHDCFVGDCTCIMPGVNISGMVKIGKGVLVGTGASLLNNLAVGDRCKVGAGAVVIRSLPENCTAVGVPAKTISA